VSLRARPFAGGARVALAAVLGLAAALLVACSGSTGKLIPVADAGPLQGDFETVAQAAEAGNGSCSETEAAITKTEQDFSALPTTVDAGLRNTLRNGIENLRSHALALCAQPLVQTTTTSNPKTTTTTIVPTETQTSTTPTTPTATTPTTPATTTTPPTSTTPGGGTAAPGVGEAAPGGSGQGGAGPPEGATGENGAAGGAGAAGPQEGVK
jgi:hypothetical protein